MEAIEFKAKVKNGKIEIPKKYQNKISDTVKVIIFHEPVQKDRNLLDELLRNPLKIDHFSPLTREEIYGRK